MAKNWRLGVSEERGIGESDSEMLPESNQVRGVIGCLLAQGLVGKDHDESGAKQGGGEIRKLCLL